MSIDRTDLVKESFEKKAVPVEVPAGRTSDYYGELVFDRAKMCKYLDADTLKALLECIDKGVALDRKTADGVARGMKEWAMAHNVTHVTHWFQPLTEGTAEKHDSLIDYDGKGGVIETFDGKSLAQQEPDASSFPSGGIRATFEARGYTAWDPTSPVFIQGDTLCIPTVFISYTGEALDYKTPLKKALKAVSDAAVPVCRLFDPSVNKVYSYLGWEQEYFLVDESLYSARPDLMITGRTLMGHNSSKNQQLDDHYFGAIPSRVAAFMRDLEIEGHRLGIPLKTRHNEVAPNQFELAPIFGETNLANDQNQIVMNLMNKLARKHGFVVLFHEKPFDGVNGSGKHNNWSLGTDTGTLLFAPGKDATGNLQFITFFVNTLAAVQRHNALIKASIATATNAHRLGANEAPPAIVSAFLGRTMTEVLHKLLEVPSDTPIEIAGKKGKSVGLVEIPEIFLDNTDRNRTSPFAFTGNRFEFRAVGSSQSVSGPLTALNTMLADSLTWIADQLEEQLEAGLTRPEAVAVVVKELMELHGDAVFGGDGYSSDWHEAAVAERGLRNLPTSAEALPVFNEPDVVALFERNGVLSGVELNARYEVYSEQYVNSIAVEARLVVDMARTVIYPAALKYASDLATTYAAAEQVGASFDTAQVTAIAENANLLISTVAQLEAELGRHDFPDIKSHMEHSAFSVRPLMEAARGYADALEGQVDDALWPLPKYREMLFIK